MKARCSATSRTRVDTSRSRSTSRASRAMPMTSRSAQATASVRSKSDSARSRWTVSVPVTPSAPANSMEVASGSQRVRGQRVALGPPTPRLGRREELDLHQIRVQNPAKLDRNRLGRAAGGDCRRSGRQQRRQCDERRIDGPGSACCWSHGRKVGRYLWFGQADRTIVRRAFRETSLVATLSPSLWKM